MFLSRIGKQSPLSYDMCLENYSEFKLELKNWRNIPGVPLKIIMRNLVYNFYCKKHGSDITNWSVGGFLKVT